MALRAEGHDHPGDVDALAALAAYAPSCFPDPTLIEQARNEPAALAELATAVLGWWLATITTAPPVGS